LRTDRAVVACHDKVAHSNEAHAAAVVMFFIVVVVMLRIVILLPAIAVDAPGASIGNGFADTRGHAWFILKVYFAVVLLFFLSIVLIAVLARLGGGSGIFHGSDGSAVALGTIFSSLGFLMVTSLMIVQARLFMRIGDRVKGDAASAGD
jgi:preprotein translocase subunit SecG